METMFEVWQKNGENEGGQGSPLCLHLSTLLAGEE